MFKKTCFFVVLFFITLLVIFYELSVYQSHVVHRDILVLMHKYYKMKNRDPRRAEQFLLMILAQDPDHVRSLQELSQWYLAQHDLEHATPLLQRLQRLDPTSYPSVFEPQMPAVQAHMPPMIVAIKPSLAPPRLIRTLPYKKIPKHTAMRAWRDLQERAFVASRQGDANKAVQLLSKAYVMHPTQQMAMQLGYWCDALQQKGRAYQYFKQATQGSHRRLARNAQCALTHLAGQQTTRLPSPYFAELFLTPFTQSRFGLTVDHNIARFGLEQHNIWHTREYVFHRFTKDNNSRNRGELTQLYEDNVEIMGGGAQIQPLTKLPMVAFIETGAAYDLVYQNRPRWRADLRTGVMYYQECGSQPDFWETMTFNHRYYANWYGELTYFTRYNNVIGGIRTNQGIRLLQYHRSLINLYMTARVIGDSRRLFFNNYAEAGPGAEASTLIFKPH